MKEELKAAVLEDLKLDFFGVASVDRFMGAPEGHKPENLLPGAESVIAMGARILEGVRRASLRVHYEQFPRHLFYSYIWYGYSVLNWFILDQAAYIVAKMLEENGHVALPVASSGAEWKIEEGGTKRFGQFSNRHAAVAAGCGEFGLSGLVLNPKTGPRARWVSVITTAELTPDPLYNGPKLCRPELCRKICEEEFGVSKPMCHYACPVEAFNPQEMRKATIGDKTYTYSNLNAVKCAWTGGIGKIGGKISVPENIKTFEDIEREAVLHSDPIAQREKTFAHRAHYCGKCLIMCPSPTFENPLKAARVQGYKPFNA
jgi:epoxyqueuosine reductase QueG